MKISQNYLFNKYKNHYIKITNFLPPRISVTNTKLNDLKTRPMSFSINDS